MSSTRETPDWVVCSRCRAVYAPALVGAVICPKCGDPQWEPSAIPDSDEPIETPLARVFALVSRSAPQPAPAHHARWM